MKQHKMLQKTMDINEMNWRLEVLEAASKFVDRQVLWTNSFAERCSETELAVDFDDAEEDEDNESAISLIPTHIGYTRRPDVVTTPSEALEESLIVKITEKGKYITDSILKSNELRLDFGAERVFSLTEKTAKGLVNIGSIICRGEVQFGIIIDSLYFIFYENIEHIKQFIGNGDVKKGDNLVRQEDIYQCIFRIKDIRNDMRHDLNHGSETERKKKKKKIGEYYKRYCGCRPFREKDFKKLQNNLYDEIIMLEECLLNLIINATREVGYE